MGTNTLHDSDHPGPQSLRKRSFTLPSFRKSAGQRLEAAPSVRKAAAWQPFTHAVGEVLAPTKAPFPAAAAAGSSPALHVAGLSGVGCGRSQGGAEVISNNKNEPLEARSQRAASRFKVEASSRPLYDEFELSSLRNHMADFVQHLQKQQKAQDSSQAVAYGDERHSPAAAPATIPPASSTTTFNRPFTASSTTTFNRPFTALHRFFRKLISVPIIKNRQYSPVMITTSSPAARRPLAPPMEEEEEEEDAQYQNHHYIHHYHHHYHYGRSPEGGAAIIGRQKHSKSSGHSESSSIRPQMTNPWKEVEEDGEGEIPIESNYLARRRRHSDSIADHYSAEKAISEAEEEWEPVKSAAALQLPRMYKSKTESFMSNKPNEIPMDGSKDEIAGGLIMENTEIKPRLRRHSTEIWMEEASVKTKPGEGRATTGRGKIGGGTYKLGGAGGCLLRRWFVGGDIQRSGTLHTDDMGHMRGTYHQTRLSSPVIGLALV